MVTTRSSGGVTPERTALQLQRDIIAGQMNMDWLPQNGRPHLRSRGIQNGQNLCYQSAVLQAFMHQPPFLRLIMQHDMTVAPCSTAPCLKCHLRRLTQVYWGPMNADVPIPQNGSVQGIANLSFGTLFTRGRQDDSNLFYNWIVDTLRHAPTPALGLQIDTLYSVTLQSHDRCKVCGTPHDPTLANDTFINVGVDLNHRNITDSILASLHQDVDNVRCEICNSNQTKTRWTEIVAAPKILRIQLQILLRDEKIFHTLFYPDRLDLTAYQQVPTLPLQYQLSSVVAHNGDFVDAEEAGATMARQLNKKQQEANDHEMAVRLYAEELGKVGKGNKGAEDSEDESEQEHKYDGYGQKTSNERREDEDDDEEQQDSGGEDASEVTSSEVSDGLQEAILNSLAHPKHNGESTNDASTESEELCRDADDAYPSRPTSALGSQAQESSDEDLSDTELSEMDALRVEAFREDPSHGTSDQPPAKREKVMMGHYVTSVREPDDTFSTINDSGVRSISHGRFLTNPQRSNRQEFQVYILTYIRDDSKRNMPVVSERWSKEIDRLMVNASKEGVTQLRFPNVKPSKKQFVEQSGQLKRGTKRKRGKR